MVDDISGCVRGRERNWLVFVAMNETPNERNQE
jgi:hypothetical protein